MAERPGSRSRRIHGTRTSRPPARAGTRRAELAAPEDEEQGGCQGNITGLRPQDRVHPLGSLPGLQREPGLAIREGQFTQMKQAQNDGQREGDDKEQGLRI